MRSVIWDFNWNVNFCHTRVRVSETRKCWKHISSHFLILASTFGLLGQVWLKAFPAKSGFHLANWLAGTKNRSLTLLEQPTQSTRYHDIITLCILVLLNVYAHKAFCCNILYIILTLCYQVFPSILIYMFLYVFHISSV